MDINFIRGLFYGVTITAIIGFVLGRMGKAMGTFKQRNKPLDMFPDAIQPKTTPAKIVRQSTQAIFAWAFWFLVLLVIFVIIIVIVRYWWISSSLVY